MRKYFWCLIIGVVLSSCVSKKKILYVQDIDTVNQSMVTYSDPLIQPNDVLRIDVSALIPESAIPYNRVPTGGGNGANMQLLQLDGYLVSNSLQITFPILGLISVENKTTGQLALHIKQLLEDGDHLKEPTVNVRLVNAKVTILGEVKQPGTYTFTEQNITLLQALGYAGDLTINGVREDVIVIREEKGIRQISHIDLTSSDWMNGPYHFVRPNDQIIVNQNDPKVKSAGYIGNITTLLSVLTVGLTLTLLITN